ncbi:hypothetical protein HDE_07050 [Halotydeus destructor]|nr:hypothetical protein HDE_07050 [Halotydeus destructor]
MSSSTTLKIKFRGFEHIYLSEKKTYEVTLNPRIHKKISDIGVLLMTRWPGLKTHGMKFEGSKGTPLVAKNPVASIPSTGLTVRCGSLPDRTAKLPAKPENVPKLKAPVKSSYVGPPVTKSKTLASILKGKAVVRKSAAMSSLTSRNRSLVSPKKAAKKEIPKEVPVEIDSDSDSDEVDKTEVVNKPRKQLPVTSASVSSPAAPPPLRRLKKEETPEMPAKKLCNWSYSKLDDMNGFPKMNDVVAFKMMHLEKVNDQLYSKLSDFKEGKIVALSNKSGFATVALTEPLVIPDSSIVGPGKVHTITVEWDTILFPKLVSRL